MFLFILYLFSEEAYTSPEPTVYPLTKEMRSADWFSSYPYQRYQETIEIENKILPPHLLNLIPGIKGLKDYNLANKFQL